MDSRSRWLVGSSRIKKLPLANITREIMQRTFSPPDNTLHFLKTSSPEKSILPKKPRTYDSSLSSENCRSQSTRLSSDLKYFSFSFGRYADVIVCPNLN